MRVGINARALAKPDPAGVSRYTRELVRALAERADAGEDDATYLFFGVDGLPAELDGFDAVRSAGEPAPAHSGLRAHLWEQVELPRAIATRDLDVFHTPAGNPPAIAPVPLVTTIHDVSPVTHPEWFSTGYAALYRVLTPLTVRRSDRLLAVSAFTRSELRETYPAAAGKTEVVHNGVTAPTPAGETTPVSDLSDFLLFVGSTNPRKNLGTLLSAYGRYRAAVDDAPSLALAGPDRDVFAGSDHERPDGVHALGYVTDDELGWLYRNARAFVYPSLYEGFGLPVLEAMQVGTPVVTSDRGATAEVAGGAARLVDPQDPAAVAEGIVDAVSDAEHLAHRGRERVDEFSWARSARETADVYRSAAEGS